MKKEFFLIVVVFYICCTSQNEGKNEERDLKQRFSGFLKAVEEMNIDRQAYTYPKLFTILPLDESRKSMETSLDFLKGKAELDSVRIDSLHPISRIENGQYSIAVYSMLVKSILDPDEYSNRYHVDTTGTVHLMEQYPSPRNILMAALIESKYGIEVIDYNEANGISTMHIKVFTIAVKDEYAKDWTFFTITKDQETINNLFSKKVLEKLVSKE